MATRYVRKSGSDSNGGTSPADAWLTIGKALGASGLSSGDTCYIGAGIYREVVTVAMTSAVAETKLIGDVSGGFTGDLGDVILSGWTTSDVAAGSSSSLIALAGRDFLTFEGIRFESYNAKCIDGNTTTATNLTVRRCVFAHHNSNGAAIEMTCPADTALNLLVEQCSHFGNQGFVSIIAATSASADYDVGVTIRNCEAVVWGGSRVINFTTSGALSFKPGGGKILQCSLFSGDHVIRAESANCATSIPLEVYECLLGGRLSCVNANISGQLIEDWNVMWGSRTNVTAGSNSVAGSPPTRNITSFDMGSARLSGRQGRPHFEPRSGSPILGFVPVGSETGEQSVDLLNRPRPAGGSSLNYAVGAFERHETAAKETSVTDAGPSGLKIVGPGDHDLRVPVLAASTTITIKARYDTTHSTTTKPQAILLANDEIGVSTETKTMTSAADTWETLTFSAFTPTVAGVVTIRLRSRPAAGGGTAYFDTLTVV